MQASSLAFWAMSAAVITGGSYVLAIFFTLLQVRRYSRPALWLLLGLGVWSFSFVVPMALQAFLASQVSASEMGQYVMMINVVRSALHAVGLVFVLMAVFCDRNRMSNPRTASAVEPLASPEGRSDKNPFSSPRA